MSLYEIELNVTIRGGRNIGNRTPEIEKRIYEWVAVCNMTKTRGRKEQKSIYSSKFAVVSCRIVSRSRVSTSREYTPQRKNYIKLLRIWVTVSNVRFATGLCDRLVADGINLRFQWSMTCVWCVVCARSPRLLHSITFKYSSYWIVVVYQ